MDVVLLNEIYAPVEMIICFFYKTNMVSLIVLFSFVISTLYSWDNWHLVIVYYPSATLIESIHSDFILN